ncbi:MAG: hypothetical protein HY558_08540 [Euryarchaeota archaeon]|nr:hypothetical protein [Euryarchaeota archaeon]
MLCSQCGSDEIRFVGHIREESHIVYQCKKCGKRDIYTQMGEFLEDA